MKPKRGNRAALYARYSTDRQCSTEIQIAKMLEFCAQRGLTVEPLHIYKDEGKTGMRIQGRDDYLAMLTAARVGAFDYIVLYDLTRGGRDVVNWFTFRREMMALGVEVLSLHDRLGNIDDPADFLPELISVGIGQTHVLTSRLKSMDKVDYLAQQGKFLGGYTPLGYRIENGEYLINEPEAEIVRMIFSMYAAGASYNQILDKLPQGLTGRRGRPLGKNSIGELLRNERYVGTYSWCKRQIKYFSAWAGGGESERAVVIEDAIPPIVDKQTWERVRTRMEANKKNRVNKGKREYILSGLLHCGECGAALVGGTTTNKKGYEHKYYACGNKYRTRTCKLKNISANDIEPLLCTIVRKALLDGALLEASADAILAAGRRQNSAASAESLRAELAEIKTKITNLLDVLDGGFKSDAILEKLTLLEGRKKTLELKLENLQPDETLTREFLLEKLRRDAEALREDPSLIRSMLHKYIVRVSIFDDRIEIVSTADFSLVVPELIMIDKDGNFLKKTEDPGISSKVFSTIGCGGQI